MKKQSLLRLFSLALVMVLCVSRGKSETKGATNKSSKSAKAIRSKFFDANKEMEEFAAEKGLMNDPRIKASAAQFFEAHKAVTQMRKAHPDLLPIYKKSDELESQAIQFSLTKDVAAYKQVMVDYKTLRTELERVANTLPEIIEAQRQVTRAREEQTFVLCDVVAESGAAGKKMADNVRKLLTQLQASKK